MEFENTFTVPVPVADAWDVLLDVQRVATCIPGATLDSVDGDTFAGSVKVKVGPVVMTYRGTARFVTVDEGDRRAVIQASGKEARGSGTADATITTSLAPAGESTRADVVTELRITGRPAQFGRGVLADVASNLIAQFADRLAVEVSTPDGTPAPGATPEGGVAGRATAAAAGDDGAPLADADQKSDSGPEVARPQHAQHEANEPIDLMGVAAGPILKRVVPLLLPVVVGLALVWIRRRVRSRTRS